jgi:hypothetical protein
VLASIGSLGLALILSVVGIFLDGRKVFAIIGAVIAGLTALAFLALIVCAYVMQSIAMQ